VKRLSAIVGQVLPFLSQEHQQQVATAVERAKQVTMSELNSVIGVRLFRGQHIHFQVKNCQVHLDTSPGFSKG
jgi:groucho